MTSNSPDETGFADGCWFAWRVIVYLVRAVLLLALGSLGIAIAVALGDFIARN